MLACSRMGHSTTWPTSSGASATEIAVARRTAAARRRHRSLAPSCPQTTVNIAPRAPRQPTSFSGSKDEQAASLRVRAPGLDRFLDYLELSNNQLELDIRGVRPLVGGGVKASKEPVSMMPMKSSLSCELSSMIDLFVTLPLLQAEVSAASSALPEAASLTALARP